MLPLTCAFVMNAIVVGCRRLTALPARLKIYDCTHAFGSTPSCGPVVNGIPPIVAASPLLLVVGYVICADTHTSLSELLIAASHTRQHKAPPRSYRWASIRP